jgi:hypothetical protein
MTGSAFLEKIAWHDCLRGVASSAPRLEVKSSTWAPRMGEEGALDDVKGHVMVQRSTGPSRSKERHSM